MHPRRDEAIARQRLLAGYLALAILLSGVLIGVLALRVWDDGNERRDPAGRVPIAVLGDSDSHVYRDDVRGIRRGGEYHDVTFQWTEVLAALRPEDVDFGTFGPWGQRGRIAQMRAFLGMFGKAPPKSDYRYNFALSGARCAQLRTEYPRQARWAVSLLRSDPERWDRGLVVLKIGVNDVGQIRHLEEYAQTGLTPDVLAVIERCASEIGATVRDLRAVSSVAIVVVGVADDSSWPVGTVPDWSHEQVARIRDVLGRFDAAVARAVEGVDRVALMDDRSWYYGRWPDRDERSRAQVGGVTLGGVRYVTNTRGDHPSNLMLEDGHAGTVANGFWARELIRTVNRGFGLGISPLLDGEIARLADPDGRLEIAPSASAPGVPPTVRLSFETLTVMSSDPVTPVGAVEARDANGGTVSETAVGFLDDSAGARQWILGDGQTLAIDPRRHGKGQYRLVVHVRDLGGNRGETEARVAIR